MARPDAIDSNIEQQLVESDSLFDRMSEGVEDEPEVVEEQEVEESEEEYTEEVEEEDTEDVEDDPQEMQYEDDDDEPKEKPSEKTPQLKKTKLYSPTELKELLASGDFNRIDTSRLSEEGQLVMKSMQSGLTPKLQEAAELRKELAALREDVTKALPKPKPKDIYEAYDQDPMAVDTFINNQIDEAIANDDRVELERLKEYRDRLRYYKTEKAQKQEAVQPSDAVLQKTAAQLVTAIPDIQEVQVKLRDYALEVMGYQAEELAEATDLKRGLAAVREIQRIKNAYDKYNAPKKAQAKAKKKRPTSVEKPGGGFERNETTIKDMKSQAMKTGKRQDWMKVFEAMED